MIFGNGVDITEVERIFRLKEVYGEKFLNKVFTSAELEYCFSKKNKNSCSRSLAARFAAKEAFVKALGTGVAKGVNFKDVEVIQNQDGKPLINLYGKSKELSEKHKIKAVHLSMSHIKEYAIANVILER
jgi:holo-[acyl-carrier protein] synthase